MWSRLEKTTFLTDAEKRALIGYGPKPLTPKFNPHHLPAGPGGGQFTTAPDGEGDGSEGGDNSNPNTHHVAARKKGGISKELYNWTVKQFASKYCKGYIQGELPGELKDLTIGDIIDIAKGGDAAAKKCYKLLNEPRFRK